MTEELKRYAITDNGDYEWVIDLSTGNEVSLQVICDALNARTHAGQLKICGAEKLTR